MTSPNIEIYQVEGQQTEIEVKLSKETVWLSQRQMGELFDKDSDTIGLHLKNIYESSELQEDATTEKSSAVQVEGTRKVKRKIKLYNLDAIISVGYRVNSKRGTLFRIWANQILKSYLIEGYSINERKLKEKVEKLSQLQKTISIIGNVSNKKKLTGNETEALLKLVSEYSYALDILDQYDYQKIEVKDTSGIDTYKIEYNEAIGLIKKLRSKHGNSKLFGQEKDKSFHSSISSIYQTFEGKDLYPSIEEKAANLLYFITKNHSFTDGNKRIAAIMFLHFLERNGILYNLDGSKRIEDNALVALTLMIAVSNPDEKDTITKVVVNLINNNN